MLRDGFWNIILKETSKGIFLYFSHGLSTLEHRPFSTLPQCSLPSDTNLHLSYLKRLSTVLEVCPYVGLSLLDSILWFLLFISRLSVSLHDPLISIAPLDYVLYFILLQISPLLISSLILILSNKHERSIIFHYSESVGIYLGNNYVLNKKSFFRNI